MKHSRGDFREMNGKWEWYAKYKKGDRNPKAIDAYNTYMREYMREYRIKAYLRDITSKIPRNKSI